MRPLGQGTILIIQKIQVQIQKKSSFVGVLTAMKPLAFSGCVNWRGTQNGNFWTNLK